MCQAAFRALGPMTDRPEGRLNRIAAPNALPKVEKYPNQFVKDNGRVSRVSVSYTLRSIDRK